MTSPTDLVQPPRLAVWLVTLFAPAEEAESIPGDLHEEFSQLASKSGVAFARRWYWRQTLRSIAHLVGAGFRAAPWSTTAVAVAGFFLIRFGYRLDAQAIEAVLDRYRLYESHPDAYLFWLTNGQLMGRVLIAMLGGGIVAAVLKGREMTVTMALGLFMAALNLTGSVMNVARTGDYGFLWTLPWSLSFSIAIVAGGAIVRRHRSATLIRPSAT